MRTREFEPQLASLLPETHALLQAASLHLHPSVERVVLHGSRGLAGGCRPDSDVDLSLLVDPVPAPPGPELEALLRDVLHTTLDHWQAPVEADLAAIFDIRSCGLACFDRTTWDEVACALGGVDCFSLYKIQKGFAGFVAGAGIEVWRMYPCLTIWRRQHT